MFLMILASWRFFFFLITNINEEVYCSQSLHRKQYQGILSSFFHGDCQNLGSKVPSGCLLPNLSPSCCHANERDKYVLSSLVTPVRSYGVLVHIQMPLAVAFVRTLAPLNLFIISLILPAMFFKYFSTFPFTQDLVRALNRSYYQSMRHLHTS